MCGYDQCRACVQHYMTSKPSRTLFVCWMAFGRFYYGVLGPLSLLGPSPFWTLFIKEPDAIYREPDAIYKKHVQL